jgi:hypothetical protein
MPSSATLRRATLVGPKDGLWPRFVYIRQGAVRGVKGLADCWVAPFQYEAGDLFPASAAVAGSAVTATYEAVGDTFVLALPIEPCNRWLQKPRVCRFSESAHAEVSGAVAPDPAGQFVAQTLAEQSLESPLGELARNAPVTCPRTRPCVRCCRPCTRCISARCWWSRAGGAAGHPDASRRAGPRGAGTAASLDAPIAGDGAAPWPA